MLGGDWTDGTMTDFKWRHFQGDVILWAVRWYCRYPISYRDLEEMLAERGISVDHTTIYRWVQCYAPEMEKRLRWFWRRGFDPSWRLDETYVKVRGKWTYLVLLQLGAGAKKAPFLLCDQRYVPVLSGRLEYPANNHCIRIRVTIGKHRALPLPQ